MTAAPVFRIRFARDESTRGSWILLGWPASEDASVPEPVVRVLSCAFVSVARVTFGHDELEPPLADEWRARGEQFVRVHPSGAHAHARFVQNAATRLGFSYELGVISTRRAATAAMAFDCESFPWWHQGQVVLLSSRDAGPPNLGAPLASDDALFDADASVRAVVRALGDGDRAGIQSRDVAFENALVDALREVATAEGVAFEDVGAESFGSR